MHRSPSLSLSLPLSPSVSLSLPLSPSPLFEDLYLSKLCLLDLANTMLFSELYRTDIEPADSNESKDICQRALLCSGSYEP
jgi:hypothetical protein